MDIVVTSGILPAWFTFYTSLHTLHLLRQGVFIYARKNADVCLSSSARQLRPPPHQ